MSKYPLFDPTNQWTFLEILAVTILGPILVPLRLILVVLLLVPTSLIARLILIGFTP